VQTGYAVSFWEPTVSHRPFQLLP